MAFSGQKFVLVMTITITLIGYISGLGAPVFGADYGAENPNAPDSGNDIGLGIAGDFLSGITGFLENILPPLTGIEIVDQVITNGFSVFIAYKGIVLLRGGGG